MINYQLSMSRVRVGFIGLSNQNTFIERGIEFSFVGERYFKLLQTASEMTMTTASRYHSTFSQVISFHSSFFPRTSLTGIIIRTTVNQTINLSISRCPGKMWGTPNHSKSINIRRFWCIDTHGDFGILHLEKPSIVQPRANEQLAFAEPAEPPVFSWLFVANPPCIPLYYWVITIDYFHFLLTIPYIIIIVSFPPHICVETRHFTWCDMIIPLTTDKSSLMAIMWPPYNIRQSTSIYIPMALHGTHILGISWDGALGLNPARTHLLLWLRLLWGFLRGPAMEEIPERSMCLFLAWFHCGTSAGTWFYSNAYYNKYIYVYMYIYTHKCMYIYVYIYTNRYKYSINMNLNINTHEYVSRNIYI